MWVNEGLFECLFVLCVVGEYDLVFVGVWVRFRFCLVLFDYLGVFFFYC